MTDMWTITAQGPKRAIQKAADALAWADPSPATAVSHFEVTRFTWRLEALSEDETAAKDAVALCNQTAPDIEWRIAPLVQEDWIAKSLEGLPAVPVGRFVVAGEHAAPKAGAYRRLIRIEAGEAFGTGHHGTTKGCLLALEEVLRKRRVTRALDVGAGSGVLAIAAAKAGANALAIEIDKRAAALAVENVANNRVAPSVKVIAGDGARFVSRAKPFDLVFANILMRPLIRLSPLLTRATAPGGTLILSGLLRTQEPLVRAAYENRGMILKRRLRREAWATLIFTKPAAGLAREARSA